MGFGIVDKGPGFVTVLPAGDKTLCDVPLMQAFYKNGQADKGECYSDEEAAKQGCPDGWQFSGRLTDRGCSVDVFTEALGNPPKRPLCVKTKFAKSSDEQKLDCCMRQTASKTSGTECPPGYCQGKINEAPCYEAFRKHCLGETVRFDGTLMYDATNMLFDADCKSYVLRQDVRNGPNKQQIAKHVADVCEKAGRFAALDPLCKCVNSTKPDLCNEANCFARLNEKLVDSATCVAKECLVGQAASGTFIPPPPDGGCPDAICAPLLALKCVNLQSEEAIKIILLCETEGKISPEKAAALKKEYKITDKDLEAARKKREQGTVYVVPEKKPTGGMGADAAPEKTPFSEPTPEKNADGGSSEVGGNSGAGGRDTEKVELVQGVPNWALWTIVAVASLLIVAIAVAIAMAVRNRQRKNAANIGNAGGQYVALPIQSPVGREQQYASESSYGQFM